MKILIFMLSCMNIPMHGMLKVKRLLSSKAQRALDKKLLRATRENNAPLVRDLLTKGASVETTDDKERTPLILAILRNVPDVAGALLADKAQVNRSYPQRKNGKRVYRTPLHVAVAHKNAYLVKLLIFYDADPSIALMPIGFTALHIAAHNGSPPEILAILLMASADVNAQSTTGETPLVLALQEKNYAAVPLLLEAGADPRIPSNSGSALDWVNQDTPEDVQKHLTSRTLLLPTFLGTNSTRFRALRFFANLIGYHRSELTSCFNKVKTLLLLGKRCRLPRDLVHKILLTEDDLSAPFWSLMIYNLKNWRPLPLWCVTRLSTLLHRYRIKELRPSLPTELLLDTDNSECLQQLIKKKSLSAEGKRCRSYSDKIELS